MKFLCQGIQKLLPIQIRTQTDRQTHRQYENITFPHTRAVNIIHHFISVTLIKAMILYLYNTFQQFITGKIDISNNIMRLKNMNL